jgi:hypothetical protein
LAGGYAGLKRCQSLTDREVLALKFTLTVAQEIVAVEAGYQSWAELKAATVGAPKTPRASSGQQFLQSVAARTSASASSRTGFSEVRPHLTQNHSRSSEFHLILCFICPQGMPVTEDDNG